MSFIARLQRAREILEQQGRLSARALERELEVGGDELEELIEELVDVQQVARREGRVLVWIPPPTNNLTSSYLSAVIRHPQAADKAEARKVVTIVFADLIGSTALHEHLDAESARALMDRYYRALHVVVEAHGGSVVKLLGDGVMAAFGVPRVAEDDAIRAVRAAVEIVQAVRVLGVTVLGEEGRPAVPRTANPLSVRVAVNTGEVVVSADNDDVVGDPVNVAARLQQEAGEGDVVIGESTRRLVGTLVTLAPLGVVALRGRSESVAAYRVVSLERPAGASAIAFVGRDDELRRLKAVYDAAVAAPAARLAVILGSPGLGKSRLLDEIARRLDRATVLTAHCESAGGATFAPIARALRARLHIEDTAGGEDVRAAIAATISGDEGDRERIAGGIGALLAGTPASPEETFFVIRRFLTALAATPLPSPEASEGMRPVVLAIDDLQWAEPLLLDLVEHLVQWGKGLPLLLLVAARPDLRDLRSSLTQPGDLVSEVVTLGGLDAAAATRLAASVIGADALPAAVAGRVLATSEGNPLFVGELVRMLVDDGALKREGDRWTAAVDLAALEMPPTIHALLAARIERLGAEDRLVLERAAIVGRQFSRAAVAELLPAESVAHLDARLEALRRSELIDADASWFLGEPALRFHHGLTRDAAYRRVLKGTRAELHGRCAAWIEGRVGDSIEHDEAIGWHLEQAHQHLRELGPLDAQGRAFGERASRYLAAAGRRALGRDDLSVAADLLGRALNLLDPADPVRADLALDWCEALLAAGEVGRGRGAIDELTPFIGDSDRLRAWHTCFAGQLAVLTDPQALHATAGAVATATEQLAAVGDDAGEAKGHLVHALALSRLGKIGACEAELDKALAAARRADDRRRANTVLANAPLAALWGPSPVTRASGRCLDVVRVLRITQGAPAVEAVALRCQAVLEALRGRSDAARRMIASARRMVEELGITQGLFEADFFAGLIALIEGDNVAAEHSLRQAYDGLRRHGLRIDAARAAALLGRTLLPQGRAAEAEALSHESEALAGDDLQAAITWRRVRAEALARRGDHVGAIEFAGAAVDIAAGTDALLHHADARLALAAALRAAGQLDEAAAEEARAIELWEAKGATVLAERVRRAAGQAPRGEPAPAQPERSVRRVLPNMATAHAARLSIVIAARDLDTLPLLIADDVEALHHPTQSRYGREEMLRSLRATLEAPEGKMVFEPLATLGDSLALCRQWTSASGVVGANFDIGAFEIDYITLLEVDEQGRRCRGEYFAADRLGDAVARLYKCYAELLPEGSDRERAAATARSVAALPLAGPHNLDRFDPATFAPGFEYVDHRTIGIGSFRGWEALRENIRALLDLLEVSSARTEDVLALRPNGLLLRWTHFGTDRGSGGAFERRLCHMWVFGDDGLMTRGEQFDVECEEEALARFEEFVATELIPQARPLGKRRGGLDFPLSFQERGPGGEFEKRRRVRPNAATANEARLVAAMAARDGDALPDLIADDLEAVHHPTGLAFDKEGNVSSLRTLLESDTPRFEIDTLATLGGSLSLSRNTVSASSATTGTLEFGAFEAELVVLCEVDQQARCRRLEFFAADHLGDAVVRLYERYAELLAEGPARTRAAATARSVAALLGPPWKLEERLRGPLRSLSGPDFEATDHRTVGFGSMCGKDAVLRAVGALRELSDDVDERFDGVLDLRPDALLLRWTTSGTVRASGGAFEQDLCMLWIFGADGLATRWEQFDAEQETEALARFDALVLSPSTALAKGSAERQVLVSAAARIENMATRLGDRFADAWAAHDWQGIAALFAPDFRLIDRRSYAQLELALDQHLESLRFRFEMRSSRTALEVLATRGHRLALLRQRFELAGDDVGPSETESLNVAESDEHGKFLVLVTFDPDDLDAAYAELDGRYAAGE